MQVRHFKKAIKAVVLCGSITIGSLSSASLSTEVESSVDNEAEVSSLGSPLTIEEIFELTNGPLATLETPIDSLPEDEDIATWTDEQIEAYYDSELSLVSELLEEVSGNPQAAWSIQEFDVAAKKKTGKSGLSAVTCLAAAIAGEAQGESYAGKLAVGQTIMARAGGKASKICSVIYAKAQFESIKRGRLPKASAESVKAARATLAKGGGCGFDHFLNKKLQRSLGRKIPKWVHNFERRGCKSKQVGQHTFYSSCSCKRK